MSEALSPYLENNKLINDTQFGYRSKRSTDFAATYLCDKIRMHVNNGELVGAVYIDLSRVFDTINHSTLLNKLSMYGIVGNELEWFTSYLFARKQIVVINGS